MASVTREGAPARTTSLAGILLVVGSAVAWSYGGAIQRFIGVDVPLSGVDDIRQQAGVGQGMVQLARLAIKHVAVGVAHLKVGKQLGVIK